MSTPIFDSGWLAIPDGGSKKVTHDLGARPTLWQIFIASDSDGTYPVPAIDYFGSNEGVLVNDIRCDEMQLKFGSSYLGRTKDGNEWYDRDNYFRLLIFDTDADWWPGLGWPVCRE